METYRCQGLESIIDKRYETTEIFNISKKKECRHFVILKNRVNDLAYFNAHRFAVNGIFYTYEPR